MSATVAAADSDIRFAEEVLAADGPVLVDFWAPWCGPCRMVGPEVEALAEQYAGRLKVVKTNIDEVPEVAQRYGIMSIPMLALFKDGEVVRSVVGARPRHAIETDLALGFFAPAGKTTPAAPVADEARPATAPTRPVGQY